MKNPRARFSFLRAFTLMELLVVIAIIAILASLLFPVVGIALDQARKASAKNDVVQIGNSIVMYQTEYGRLPTNTGSNVSGDLVKILMASPASDSIVLSNNPRKIVFLEAPNYKKNKGGVDTNGNYAYLDPWSNNYLVVMDVNYSNSIVVGTNSETIRKSVGVWNKPTGTPAEIKRRYVTSWD